VPVKQSSVNNRMDFYLAIHWFKDEADDYVRRMREYAYLLDAHGIQVRRIVTDKPGYVLYEDPCQVAAVPFRDTFKNSRYV
jgi:hypothetical protein